MLQIKDLKDLSVLLGQRFSIDMQDLKDLKRKERHYLPRRAGACPPRFFSSWPVSRGPVPRDRCLARDRPSPYGKRGVLWASRGRLRSGDRKLQRKGPFWVPSRVGPRMPSAHPSGFPPRSQHGEGQALALR